MSVKFDMTDFDNKSKNFLDKIEQQSKKANTDIAYEVLRLSASEVPFDTGALLESSSVETLGDGSAIVGYNKVYAARLHENPSYNFRNGRKGKYLEDPIKNNLSVLRDFFKEQIQAIF